MWFGNPEPGSQGICLPFSVVTHSWSCVGSAVRKAKALRAGVTPWRGFARQDTLKLSQGGPGDRRGKRGPLHLGSALLLRLVPKLWGLAADVSVWSSLQAEAAKGA